MPLILHDDLLALGTALGANIGRLEQTVRFAQPLRTLQPLRRAVLGRPVHPVDAMGTLQGPFLHFTAAIWTNHALALSVPEGLRLPGTPIMFGRTRACRTFPDSASSVPEGLRLSGTPIMFGRTPPRGSSLAPAGQFTFCACRTYFDPCALGAHTPVTRRHWWWGRSRGSLLPSSIS